MRKTERRRDIPGCGACPTLILLYAVVLIVIFTVSDGSARTGGVYSATGDIATSIDADELTINSGGDSPAADIGIDDGVGFAADIGIDMGDGPTADTGIDDGSIFTDIGDDDVFSENDKNTSDVSDVSDVSDGSVSMSDLLGESGDFDIQSMLGGFDPDADFGGLGLDEESGPGVVNISVLDMTGEYISGITITEDGFRTDKTTEKSGPLVISDIPYGERNYGIYLSYSFDIDHISMSKHVLSEDGSYNPTPVYVEDSVQIPTVDITDDTPLWDIIIVLRQRMEIKVSYYIVSPNDRFYYLYSDIKEMAKEKNQTLSNKNRSDEDTLAITRDSEIDEPRHNAVTFEMAPVRVAVFVETPAVRNIKSIRLIGEGFGDGGASGGPAAGTSANFDVDISGGSESGVSANSDAGASGASSSGTSANFDIDTSDGLESDVSANFDTGASGGREAVAFANSDADASLSPGGALWAFEDEYDEYSMPDLTVTDRSWQLISYETENPVDGVSNRFFILSLPEAYEGAAFILKSLNMSLLDGDEIVFDNTDSSSFIVNLADMPKYL